MIPYINAAIARLSHLASTTLLPCMCFSRATRPRPLAGSSEDPSNLSTSPGSTRLTGEGGLPNATGTSGHSASNPKIPAIDRILIVTEVFEKVLLQLPAQDLLFSQRVSRTWKSIMDGSITVQRRLFFQPEAESVKYTYNKERRTLRLSEVKPREADWFQSLRQSFQDFTAEERTLRPVRINRLLFSRGQSYTHLQGWLERRMNGHELDFKNLAFRQDHHGRRVIAAAETAESWRRMEIVHPSDSMILPVWPGLPRLNGVNRVNRLTRIRKMREMIVLALTLSFRTVDDVLEGHREICRISEEDPSTFQFIKIKIGGGVPMTHDQMAYIEEARGAEVDVDVVLALGGEDSGVES